MWFCVKHYCVNNCLSVRLFFRRWKYFKDSGTHTPAYGISSTKTIPSCRLPHETTTKYFVAGGHDSSLSFRTSVAFATAPFLPPLPLSTCTDSALHTFNAFLFSWHVCIFAIIFYTTTVPPNVSSKIFLSWKAVQFKPIEVFTITDMSLEKLLQIIVYPTMRSLRPYLDAWNQSVDPSTLFGRSQHCCHWLNDSSL